MGIITIPLLLLVYWIANECEKRNDKKRYEEYQEHKRRLGLK